MNEFISARRRTRRLVPSGRGAEIDDRVSPDHAGQHAERADLLAELGKLPRRQRNLLVIDPATGAVLAYEQVIEPLPGQPARSLLPYRPGEIFSWQAWRAQGWTNSGPRLPARRLGPGSGLG